MCCLSNDIFLRKGDFNGSPNIYQNKVLNQRFRVLLDRHIVLEPVIEWNKLTSGGFEVIIPGFTMEDDTILTVQFY